MRIRVSSMAFWLRRVAASSSTAEEKCVWRYQHAACQFVIIKYESDAPSDTQQSAFYIFLFYLEIIHKKKNSTECQSCQRWKFNWNQFEFHSKLLHFSFEPFSQECRTSSTRFGVDGLRNKWVKRSQRREEHSDTWSIRRCVWKNCGEIEEKMVRFRLWKSRKDTADGQLGRVKQKKNGRESKKEKNKKKKRRWKRWPRVSNGCLSSEHNKIPVYFPSPGQQKKKKKEGKWMTASCPPAANRKKKPKGGDMRYTQVWLAFKSQRELDRPQSAPATYGTR